MGGGKREKCRIGCRSNSFRTAPEHVEVEEGVCRNRRDEIDYLLLVAPAYASRAAALAQDLEDRPHFF